MAYQTYTTDALVIGSVDRLTADRVIILFTREAGLVYARAMGVRKEQSKLRYGLQDFSRARVSLVRGKQGWRVVGAERAHNLYYSTNDRTVRAAQLRIVKLLRRLVRGEEAHATLFDTVFDGLVTFVQIDPEDVDAAERILTLRILATLGYVAPQPGYAPLLQASSLADALSAPSVSVTAVRHAIDEALAVSHL